jgi:hypothetical protein
MQYLHRNFAVFRVNSTCDDTMLLNLVAEAELRGKRADASGEIWSDSSSHDEANSAARAFRKVNLNGTRCMHEMTPKGFHAGANSASQAAHRHLLKAAFCFLESGVHGAHDGAVFELGEAEIQRSHQTRIM